MSNRRSKRLSSCRNDIVKNNVQVSLTKCDKLSKTLSKKQLTVKDERKTRKLEKTVLKDLSLEKKKKPEYEHKSKKVKDTKPRTKSIKFCDSDKVKEIKIKQQMKLGRIFINPMFPIKSILKRNINLTDKKKELKDGQPTVTNSTIEKKNVVKYLVPRIVLCKIDERF